MILIFYYFLSWVLITKLTIFFILKTMNHFYLQIEQFVYQSKKIEVMDKEAVDAANTNANFALALFKKLAKSENLIMSPYR